MNEMTEELFPFPTGVEFRDRVEQNPPKVGTYVCFKERDSEGFRYRQGKILHVFKSGRKPVKRLVKKYFGLSEEDSRFNSVYRKRSVNRFVIRGDYGKILIVELGDRHSSVYEGWIYKPITF